eukprot:NODE_959_length_2744_cov_0.250662.p1 type:complete len:245 gc:universal NODE_959_length_2744_cov_0.250662:368-1102(+)
MDESSSLIEGHFNEPMHRFTRISKLFLLGYALQLVGALLISFWSLSPNVEDQFLGGVNPFTLHPLMMTLSFTALTPLAIFAFQLMNHSHAKICHATCHSFTLIFSITGLVSIFTDHNYPSYGEPKPNLYSAHSWAGIFFLILFYFNFATSALVFFGKKFRSHRTIYLKYHRQIGIWILITSCAIICSGIIRKQTFMKCTFEVSQPDYNPISHYFDAPYGCRVANWAVVSLVVGNFIMTLGLVNQ